MSKPRFTQKHYEHLMVALHCMGNMPIADRGVSTEQLEGAAEFLCRVLEQDNPKFKRDRFLRGASQKEPTR